VAAPHASRSLSDADIEAICLRLTEFSGLTPEEHRDHHNAFAAYIERQRRSAEFWDKVRAQVGGWMIISALGLIGTAVWKVTWYAVNTYLKGSQQ
jgi:hypothetical protein